MDDNELQWSSPEFHFIERSARWYLASLCVAFVLAVFALFQKNFLFFIFIIVGEATLLFVARQKPRMFSYEITGDGVRVDGTMIYPFGSLRGFAIVDDGISGYVELLILPAKKFAQYTKILMPRQLTDAAFAVLASRLPVLPYEEKFTEVLMKRIGL